MEFLANENVEKPVVDELRSKGFEVKYLLELRPRLSDEAILKIAQDEGRIIITNDKDFGELIFFHQKLTTGVILLRFAKELSSLKTSTLIKYLSRVSLNDIKGKFIVISESKVRRREILRNR